MRCCAGTGVATQIAAAEAGADIIDACIDSMSGLTSQPNMGAIVNALAGTKLDTGIDPKQLLVLNNYWCVAGVLAACMQPAASSVWQPALRCHQLSERGESGQLALQTPLCQGECSVLTSTRQLPVGVADDVSVGTGEGSVGSGRGVTTAPGAPNERVLWAAVLFLGLRLQGGHS